MQNNTDSRVYAGFFVRLSAYLIDWLIVGAALLVIRIPVWIANFGGGADLVLRDFIFEYSAYDIVLYLLKVAYFVLLTYFTGSTLGKKLLQIRVISTEDRKPTFFEIVFRESVGKFLSGLVLYVGYFMIGADKQKRGFHDMLSDTYVVYSHQKTVAVPAPITYNTVSYPVQRPQMPPYQAGVGMIGSFGTQNQQQFNQAGMPQNAQQMNRAVGNMAPQNQPMVVPNGMAQQSQMVGTPQNMVHQNQTTVSQQSEMTQAVKEQSSETSQNVTQESQTEEKE